MPKQSKRVPLSRKYNISRVAKEKDRKLRRAAKKNPALRKKLRKDPGIPNLNPFKEQILKRLEEQQKLIKFHQLQSARRQQDFVSPAGWRRRRRRGEGGYHVVRDRPRPLMPPPASVAPLQAKRRRLGGEDELAGLAADAAERSAAYTKPEDVEYTGSLGSGASGTTRAGEITRRQFYRHVKALLEKADILLEVLDARDPLACRAHAVEAMALACDPPKRVVLVLNKIDLVPAEVVQQWLTYLRRDLPTIAFKASTQQQRHHLSAPGGGAVNRATEAGDVLTGSGAAGTDTLLQLIKNYSRSRDMKTAVTVGVIGYPNVGKSSVINSLKRNRAVGVSSQPGHTRTLQEVALDSKVTLIDCPGVIFDDDVHPDARPEDADGGAGLLLRNCVSVEAIDDPEAAVDGILRRCAPAKLMAVYSIPAYADTNEFLRHIAAKRGKMRPGGIADKEGAARSVLQDWNSGKIPFFVLPPTAHAAGIGADAATASGDDDMAVSGAGGKTLHAPSAAASAASSGVMTSGDDLDTAAIVSSWSKVRCETVRGRGWSGGWGEWAVHGWLRSTPPLSVPHVSTRF